MKRKWIWPVLLYGERWTVYTAIAAIFSGILGGWMGYHHVLGNFRFGF